MTILLWLAVAALILVGLAGTILPALPGAVFVFAGIALGAWIVDYVAAAAGAKRAGASRLALVGAMIGTVAGVFTGFVGLLFLPLVGAALGEYVAQRDALVAGKVGVATWLGLLIGTAVKVAIAFAMVGAFLFALAV